MRTKTWNTVVMVAISFGLFGASIQKADTIENRRATANEYFELLDVEKTLEKMNNETVRALLPQVPLKDQQEFIELMTLILRKALDKDWYR